MPNKYDFKILFEKLDDVLKVEDKDLSIDLEQNKEIDEYIKYLKDIYDTSNQEDEEVITRC